MLRWLKSLVKGRSPAMLDIGDSCPAFEVHDHKGARISQAGLVGKRYVLWFYPKADTPG